MEEQPTHLRGVADPHVVLGAIPFEFVSSAEAMQKAYIVPEQIAVDGSFPLGLTRTKPYGYCLFNLDVMSTLCRLLSTPEDNLFAFSLPDGRGFARAMAFMFPFIANRTSWPYARDVEYFQDSPVRQPSLLFAGISLEKPEYLNCGAD